MKMLFELGFLSNSIQLLHNAELFQNTSRWPNLKINELN